MRKSCTLLVLLFSGLSAQNPADLFQKAPPQVDEALRQRITEFYRLQIEGKFRQAEALVAEESKDVFYASNKPRLVKCEITSIEYSEEFTKANATMSCDRYIPIAGFSDKPMTIPFASRWKVVDGQWSWYVPPELLLETPFGRRKEPPSLSPGAHPAPPAMPRSFDLKTILNQVKADKNAVRLRAGEASSDQVQIVNEMPGPVSLSVRAPEIPGVEIKLESPQIKSGEKTAVTFRSKPETDPPAAPVTVYVEVEQTGRRIPIQLSFAK